MALIVTGSDNDGKVETRDIAFESGRMVVLPSPVDVRGPLAEYSLIVSPPQPVTVHVSANLVDGGTRSAWRVSSVSIASSPIDGVSYGQIRVSTAHLIVGDVSSLYCAGNGIMWQRSKEATRAIKACSLRRRTGGRFTTDFGEPAVAIRLGRGPLLGRAVVSAHLVRITVLRPELGS